MADQEKKALGTENLEVSELEEQDLEEASGGTSTGPTVNINCPCQPSSEGSSNT
jgi:hypothetical protein